MGRARFAGVAGRPAGEDPGGIGRRGRDLARERFSRKSWRWVPLATKRRNLSEGLVLAEVDPEQKKGCLIEIRCRQAETLAAEEFREFTRDLVTHIMEKGPLYVTRNDVPWEDVRTEERNHRSEAEKTFATSDRVTDYLTEKMTQWYQQICLMEQPYAKDPSKLMGQVWETLKTHLDDPVEIRRFSYYTVDNKN